MKAFSISTLIDRCRSKLDGLDARTFLTFLAVGISGALAYVALSLVLSKAGLQAHIASPLAYASLIAPVYLLQRNLTFRSKERHLSSFPKYVATQMGAVFLSTAIPYYASKLGDLPALIAFIVVAVSVPMLTFVVMLVWTFRSSVQSKAVEQKSAPAKAKPR